MTRSRQSSRFLISRGLAGCATEGGATIGITNIMEVQIFPLVSRVLLPVPSPAGTRPHVPPGYGVEEHCLPFTAANALGFLLRSPISFGICPLAAVPTDGHAFRSPLDRPWTRDKENDRVLYVKDDQACEFRKNAFTLDALADKTSRGPVQPGISFFDREDQLDLAKLHLPYVWRTPEEVDALFLPLINRSSIGLELLCGLVETDWFTGQVNLVFRLPAVGEAVHIAAGDFVGQVIFVSRPQRRPTLKVLAAHACAARVLRQDLSAWYQMLGADRSAYKQMARSQHGRLAATAGSCPFASGDRR